MNTLQPAEETLIEQEKRWRDQQHEDGTSLLLLFPVSRPVSLPVSERMSCQVTGVLVLNTA